MPLAMVRVRADPVIPPKAVLGKETVDTERDGFGVMPPRAVPGNETGGIGLLPWRSKKVAGGGARNSCAPVVTAPGIGSDKTLREFSAWGIYVSTPAMRERR